MGVRDLTAVAKRYAPDSITTYSSIRDFRGKRFAIDANLLTTKFHFANAYALDPRDVGPSSQSGSNDSEAALAADELYGYRHARAWYYFIRRLQANRIEPIVVFDGATRLDAKARENERRRRAREVQRLRSEAERVRGERLREIRRVLSGVDESDRGEFVAAFRGAARAILDERQREKHSEMADEAPRASAASGDVAERIGAVERELAEMEARRRSAVAVGSPQDTVQSHLDLPSPEPPPDHFLDSTSPSISTTTAESRSRDEVALRDSAAQPSTMTNLSTPRTPMAFDQTDADRDAETTSSATDSELAPQCEVPEPGPRPANASEYPETSPAATRDQNAAASTISRAGFGPSPDGPTGGRTSKPDSSSDDRTVANVVQPINVSIASSTESVVRPPSWVEPGERQAQGETAAQPPSSAWSPPSLPRSSALAPSALEPPRFETSDGEANAARDAVVESAASHLEAERASPELSVAIPLHLDSISSAPGATVPLLGTDVEPVSPPDQPCEPATSSASVLPIDVAESTSVSSDANSETALPSEGPARAHPRAGEELAEPAQPVDELVSLYKAHLGDATNPVYSRNQVDVFRREAHFFSSLVLSGPAAVSIAAASLAQEVLRVTDQQDGEKAPAPPTPTSSDTASAVRATAASSEDVPTYQDDLHPLIERSRELQQSHDQRSRGISPMAFNEVRVRSGSG